MNRFNLKVADFANKGESRYAPSSILVEPGATVATNGAQLVWVSVPKGLKAENFPVGTPGLPIGDLIDDFKPFCLLTDTAKAIEKALPRKQRHFPILETAAVYNEDAEGNHRLGVTDLTSAQTFVAKPAGGVFPDYKALFLNQGEPTARFALSATYLAQIASFAAKLMSCGAGRDALVMSVYSAEKAVRFDCSNNADNPQGMTALLMPMRLNRFGLSHTYGQAPEPDKPAKPEETPE